MSTFSQEIFDTIIDFCYWDWKFLQTLALVHRSWLPSSRFHSFRRAYVTAKNRAQWLEILNSPLATFPQYVRSLSISNTGVGAQINWSFKAASEYFIHTKLSKLDELEIFQITIDGEIPDMASLSRIKTLGIMSSPVLDTSVHLFSMISAFSSLVKLEIEHAWVNDQAPAKVVPPSQPPIVPATLRAVALGLDDTDLTDAFLKWPIGSSVALTYVNMGQVHEGTVGSIGRILRSNANTLTKLELDLRGYSMKENDEGFLLSMMAFSSFNALRAIHLHIGDIEFHTAEWFLSALASIPPPAKGAEESGLKILVLSLGWHVCEQLEQGAEEADVKSDSDKEKLAKWEDFDEILSQPRFTSLEELWFIFEQCLQEELGDYISGQCLTKTEEREIIFFSEQDCMDKPESWETIPW